MHTWIVFCWVLSALVCVDTCPNGGDCVDGHTCCKNPSNVYDCCPFQQAECCEDHTHCCPEGTLCSVDSSRCVNATLSVPWAERIPPNPPTLSKSFRMIGPYDIEGNDNICLDQSQCPPEFSCLRGLTRFGCCPLTQGVPCSDGKHCCPEGHGCSADSHSCIKREVVICSDGESECPKETSCCENSDGSWGCCPIPEAVCCGDKAHCCPAGTSCDVPQSKCISLTTNKDTPMWAKLPARKIAAWEKLIDGDQAVASAISDADANEKVPEVTATVSISLFERAESQRFITPRGSNDVPCNDTVACPDGQTCCKTKEGGWACCPEPEAVCCDDHIHCCPHGTTCNLEAERCDDDFSSVGWLEKSPTIPRQADKGVDVTCNSSTSCADKTSCCKTETEGWACCPLPEAVCCADHIHCCPAHYICDLNSHTCKGPSGPEPMVEKMAAFSTRAAATVEAPTRKPVETRGEEQKKPIPCDSHTTCPEHTTCCLMSSTKKWGCCPLPEAVCCSDGDFCCPAHYKCDGKRRVCHKGEVETPGYNKVPSNIKESKDREVVCEGQFRCKDRETCCRTSSTTWGCCPSPDAVCCSDMRRCCPTGYACGEGGTCTQDTTLRWDNGQMFFSNKKKTADML